MRNQSVASSLDCGVMSVGSALNCASVAVGAALLLSNGVAAEPHQGSLDSQSRAGIAISVSVMPRINLSPSAPAIAEPRAGTVGDAFRIFANAPSLQIRLEGPSKTANVDEAAVFLIAPD